MHFFKNVNYDPDSGRKKSQEKNRNLAQMSA